MMKFKATVAVVKNVMINYMKMIKPLLRLQI